MIFEDTKVLDADLAAEGIKTLNLHPESSPNWMSQDEIEDFDGTYEWARRRYVAPLMRNNHKELT